MMLLLALCAAVAVAILFPQTTIGRWLRRILIDYPARKFPYLTPMRLTMILAALTAMAAVILCAKDPGVVFLAQGAPEAITGFMTFDVGAYMEIAALVSMLAVASRFKAAARVATLLLVRMRRFILKGSQRCRHAQREIRPRLRRLLQRLIKTDEEPWADYALRPSLI